MNTIMAPGSEIWRERLDLADYVPSYAHRVLHVGCGRGGLGRVLKSRGIEVHGVEPNPERAGRARAVLDSVAASIAPETPLEFGEAYFDCIVLNCGHFPPDQFARVLGSLTQFLGPNGFFLIVARNPLYWQSPSPGLLAMDALEAAATSAGLGVYIRKPSLDPLVHQIRPDENGSVRVAGQIYSARTDRERIALFTIETILVLVKNTYSPISHAHTLFSDGLPSACYEVLSLIPKEYLTDPAVAAGVAADMQLCVLEVQRTAPPEQTLPLFGVAQALFREAVGSAPLLAQAYQSQAEFWRRIGDPGTGIRLLESIHFVQPSEDLERQLTILRRHPSQDFTCPEPPDAAPPLPANLRVLFITHERPNYGLDVLYDGLCNVLGDEAVVEYPWKPSLHGHMPSVHGQYPCLFNRPGERLGIDQIADQLKEKRFDLVLFGDIEQHLGQEEAQRIVEAAGDIPVCVVDAQDEPQSYLESATEFLGGATIAAYFKREMLTCHDYGPMAYPLPFAYADDRVPELSDEPRPRGLFWAGQRAFGLRRLYLDTLEARFGEKFDARYSPEEYARALGESRIGLSFFGFGFDTVRYWELPAHGCMLLSERMPIQIPKNFVDGESAVFFDDTRGLLEKAEYFREHPNEARRVAIAGHRHLRLHHTSAARARQLLARVAPLLRFR
ncbi:MAG: glycosyltransferase [Candidatus Hydrogenedentes bacterium]|nr:glycosyltransferase [Candidatus Hydrogenedentota bacterium]